MVPYLSGLNSADFACPIRIVFCLKSPEGSMRAWPRTIMLLMWHKRDYWIIESQRQYHTTATQTRFVRQVLAQLIQLFSLPFDLESSADTHTYKTAARCLTDWHVDAVHVLVSWYENWKSGLLISEQNGNLYSEIRTSYPYMTWYSATSAALEKRIESALSYLITLLCTELSTCILNVLIILEYFVPQSA